MKTRFKTAAGALGALGLVVTAFIGGWEGKRNVAYQDIVGVWTVCYGETRGVERGDRFTDAQCLEMLGNGVVEFEQGVRACLKAPDAIPDKPYAMMVSLAYNIGTGAFCGSTVARRANAGDIRGACEAFTMWVKAGGRTVPGLVNRRNAEKAICLEGVTG